MERRSLSIGRRDGRALIPGWGAGHVVVEGDRLAGSMGVNRLMGEIGPSGIPGPLATTMMAGPPELMDQETALLAHLQAADSIAVDEKGMTWSKDGLNLV